MARKGPKVLSARTARWMLNAFPPLLFARVRVKSIDHDFRRARVLVKRSLLTRNLNGTTFGGSIFSGVDPIYSILYWQIFARLGERVQVWLKAATIDYKKPAATTLTLDFEVTDDDVAEARAVLDEKGYTVATHKTRAIDRRGVVCAEAETVVYMRRLREDQKEVSGF